MSPLADRVARLRSRLDALRDRIEATPAENTHRGSSAVEELLAFVRSYDDAEAYAELERASLPAEYRSCFGPAVLGFTWRMEEHVHAELMAGARAPASTLQARLGANVWGAYTRMGETLALFDVSPCRSFLMVGCGPVPDSLFYMHDHTAVARLVGADRDPRALAMARELIGALGVERIQIIDADASAIDYAAYDVICCSAFLTPRRPVLERIAASARDDAIVILRDPFSTGTLLFESVIDALPARFEVRARSAGRPGRFMLRYHVLGMRPA